jgi:hypothetical protein
VKIYRLLVPQLRKHEQRPCCPSSLSMQHQRPGFSSFIQETNVFLFFLSPAASGVPWICQEDVSPALAVLVATGKVKQTLRVVLIYWRENFELESGHD